MDNRKRITAPVSISGCRFSSELPVKVKSRPNRQYRVTDRQMPEMTQPRVGPPPVASRTDHSPITQSDEKSRLLFAELCIPEEL